MVTSTAHWPCQADRPESRASSRALAESLAGAMYQAAGEYPRPAGDSGTEQIKAHAMEVKHQSDGRAEEKHSSQVHSLGPSSSMPGHQHMQAHKCLGSAHICVHRPIGEEALPSVARQEQRLMGA